MKLILGIISSLLIAVCSGADLIQTNADDTKGLLVMTTKTLVLNCSTSSEVPSDAVTWYKSVDGGPRAAVEGDSNVVVEGGLLTIKKPTEADAGNYTCRFSTAATPDKLVEETIHVITNVSVSMPSNSINKQEDDEVTILCEPFGRPRPTVSWTKDGKDIFLAVDNASRLTLSPDDEGNADARLKLTGLRRPEDAGDYCCHAENIANAAQGCTIVRVKDKYAALWPFIGIVAEVILLTAIIYIYEKKKSKPDMDDSDTDNGNDSRPEPKGDVRQRK